MGISETKIKNIAKILGVRGGRATLRKKGRKHFVAMGKKSKPPVKK